MQTAASAPVGIDVLIEGFVADSGLSVGFEIAGYLFRAPQLCKPGLGKGPSFSVNSAAVLSGLRTRLREFMCLFGPIATLAPVSAKLAADRGGMAVHDAGDVALLMSGFQKDGNLVSFVLGEMCVFHSGQL